MDTDVPDFDVQLGQSGAVIMPPGPNGHSRNTDTDTGSGRKPLDVEAAYKDLTEQLAKVGRKEIERRINFGRTAARNRAILRCVTNYVGSPPNELQERLIEILTVDHIDSPITDMEIIQALR
jgi:hypothetical protein